MSIANLLGADEGSTPMTIYDQPFDPNHPLDRAGCVCGRHRSSAEHDYESSRTMMCEPVATSQEKTYEGVVASALMRKIFPQDAARRAFLKSVGASTALAALSQFFPLKTATELFAQAGPIEKKDLKVGFIPSPARRRSSWRTRWASIRSTG